jgi:hypothetical protein
MNRKIYLTLLTALLLILFITPIISAEMYFDNIKGDLIINQNTSKYGKVEIKDWFGILKLASLELKENTDNCGNDCSMETEIIMYQDGVLIDDVKFKERDWDNTWHDLDLKDYKFYIAISGEEWEVDDYRKECSVGKTTYLNGTNKPDCKEVLVETHTEDNYVWEEYVLGTEVFVGTYYIKLEATRPSPKWIDWIITSQGQELDFWYVWGEYIDSVIISEGLACNKQGIGGNDTIIVTACSEGVSDLYLYDRATGSYLGTIDPAGMTNPMGVAWNGSHWFIMENDDDKIFRFDASWVYEYDCILDTGTYYDLTANATDLWATGPTVTTQTDMSCNTRNNYTHTGMVGNAQNGTNFFLLTGPGSAGPIRKYNDMILTSEDGNFNLNATNNFNFGMELIGEYFYVIYYGDPQADRYFIYFNAPLAPGVSVVTTTLNSPIDYYNSTSNSITFNCSANTTSPSGEVLTNISLYIDSVLNETKDVGGTYNNSIFTKNIPDGTYDWNCLAYDNSSSFDWGTNRTLTIDTIYPQLTATLEHSIVYVPSGNVTINYTATDTNLQSCWYNYNSINTTFVCVSGVNDITNVTSVYPETQIIIYINDSIGHVNSTALSFSYDTGVPSITINQPTGTLNYGYTGKAETLNWTVVDTNLANVWYNYNGTNYTLKGAINTTEFYLKTAPFNVTLWANDSLGNTNSKFKIWDYKIFELNQSFSNATNEGSSVNFYAYVIVNETIEISSAVLNYNNTQYSGSINNLAGYSIISKTNLITPEIAANTTFTFHWTLTLDDSSILNLSAKNQTVYNLILDNCTAYGNKLFDLTLKDEELQSNLDNATLEIAINLYTSDKSTLLISLGAKYYNQNPVSICSNLNLTATNYYMDVVMKYYAEGYAQEYYNIETTSFILQNISLYDLNLTDSTDFKVTFTGIDFLPEEGVLIYVERQYIDENLFKTVELPKTDTNGQTIIHLVRNDVIYNLIFIKDGTILRRFENLRAFCDDFTIGDCKINLNALSLAGDIFTYDQELGITYESAPIYNATTNKVSFSYVSNDGISKNVTMNVERRDVFGNNSVCSNTLDSISGTLSCNIGSGITDTSLVTLIQIDGQTLISTSVQIDSATYGAIGYVAWLLLTLGLVFMFSKDKNGILIALLLSYIGAVSMGWILGGIIGLGSAGIWIIIITAIGLWKLNKNKFS